MVLSYDFLYLYSIGYYVLFDFPLCYFFFFFVFCLFRAALWNMEVPRLGVELELYMTAYTTATAMQDLSYMWELLSKSGLEPASSWILVGFVNR